MKDVLLTIQGNLRVEVFWIIACLLKYIILLLGNDFWNKNKKKGSQLNFRKLL